MEIEFISRSPKQITSYKAWSTWPWRQHVIKWHFLGGTFYCFQVWSRASLPDYWCSSNDLILTPAMLSYSHWARLIGRLAGCSPVRTARVTQSLTSFCVFLAVKQIWNLALRFLDLNYQHIHLSCILSWAQSWEKVLSVSSCFVSKTDFFSSAFPAR